MAAGIPTRMIYGSLMKPTLDGVPVDASYHCWIQFYAPNLGWVPLNVSLANIYGKEFPADGSEQEAGGADDGHRLQGIRSQQDRLLLREYRRPAGGVVRWGATS